MPYVFSADVKPAGKRNPVRLSFGGYLELDLQEAHADEAPKVVEWSRRRTHSGDIEVMSARMWNGRLFAAVTNDDGSFLRAEGLAWDDIHSFPHIGPWSEPKAIDLFNAGQLKHSVGDYRECVNSDEEAVKAEIRESSSEFLIVDGLVYRPHPVPIIKATVENYGAEGRLTLAIDYEMVASGASNTLHFPVHELDKAVAWAEEAVATSIRPISFRNDVNAVVHRPDLLPDTDFFVTDLCRTLDIVLADSGKILHIMPDGFIDSWQELRRVRNALSPKCPDDLIQSAMAAWSAYLESHDEVEEAKHSRRRAEYRPELETEHKMHAYFLPRWEGHDIQLDIGADFGRRPAF